MNDYVFLSLKLQNGDITFEEFDRLEAMESERASAYAANDTMGGTKEDYLIKNNPRVPLGNLNLIDKPKVSEDYNIDHLLVGTPSNPVDFNELRKIAEEKHRKKFVPTPFDAASIASEMAASKPKINTEDLINEVVSRNLAKYKTEGKKAATPVFKVGEMVYNTKGAVHQKEFDMLTNEELSLPGMMEVINSGNTTSVDLSDPQVVAPIEATKQRNFGLDDGLTAIERQVNKINANSKVDLNKPEWIEGKLSMVPDHTNKTHPKDPMKGMGLKYGVDFNTQFDSFDKRNVTEDKDLYQMLQELEGNWK